MVDKIICTIYFSATQAILVLSYTITQGSALTAPGRLRRLTFGLGRPAGVGFLIYSQKAKRKCCSVGRALVFKGRFM